MDDLNPLGVAIAAGTFSFNVPPIACSVSLCLADEGRERARNTRFFFVFVTLVGCCESCEAFERPELKLVEEIIAEESGRGLVVSFFPESCTAHAHTTAFPGQLQGRLLLSLSLSCNGHRKDSQF